MVGDLETEDGLATETVDGLIMIGSLVMVGGLATADNKSDSRLTSLTGNDVDIASGC